MTRHGVLVQVLGLGVLLEGKAGIGKSELALELVSRGHALVADDAVELRREGDSLIGSAPPLLYGRMEVRGLGILDLRRLYGAASVIPHSRIDLVIRLLTEAPTLEPEQRLSGIRYPWECLGVALGCLPLWFRAGLNPAVLIEACVRDLHLRRGGFEADRLFVSEQSSLCA